MTNLLVQEVSKKFINKKVPVLRPGYQVRVHQKIKEGNKERIQVFEGMVISMNAGHGPSKTFTVRKVVQGIGVEKIFPLYSPKIAKIDVKKTFGVRRAKLSYLRNAKGTSKRLSAKLGLLEKDEILKQKKGMVEEQEATMEEAVKKVEKEEAEKATAEGEGAQTAEAKAEAPEETKEETKEAASTESKEPEIKTEAQMQEGEKVEIEKEEAAATNSDEKKE